MIEETPTSQVPLLDLAPKLKRPLSLWNPLDYLRLLYWVFYFPQAIQWYIETFCEHTPESNQLKLRQLWELINNSPRKIQLVLMSLLLAIFVPTLLCFCLNSLGWHGDSNDVMISIVISIVISIAFSLTDKVAGSVAFSVALSTMSVMYGISWEMKMYGVVGGAIVGSVSGLKQGIFLGVIQSVMITYLPISGELTSFNALYSIGYGVYVGAVTTDAHVGVMAGIAFFLASTLASSVAILRLDNRLLSLGIVPRVTPLILPRLTRQVGVWLEADWERGLMNVNQVLKYSRQLATVNVVINQLLSNTSSVMIFSRIATLSDVIWDWKILRYTSASLSDALKAEFIKTAFWFPYKSWFVSRWGASLDLRFDTEAHTAAAGFWYLHQASKAKGIDESVSVLTKAVEVFENLRQIRHGDEMYKIAINIRNFRESKDLEDLLNLPLTQFPPDSDSPSKQSFSNLLVSDPTIPSAIETNYFIPIASLPVNNNNDVSARKPPLISHVEIFRPLFDLLRPQTWNLINNLSIALLEIAVLSRSTSRTKRSYALNRALGEITEVLTIIDTLPPEVSRLEKPILKDIATRWRDILLSAASEIGKIEIDKPISNPYTIGDPVIGERFIGREDILRQLEELWFINTRPQSVILYGHRRMGKTSILRNATTKVNTEVRVAYVNLLSVSSANNGITDILMAICDALEEVTEIPVPSNNDLLQFPEITFRRYLEQITKTFTGKGLIIALDEFEKIEELIDAGKLGKEFLGFLRGMVQMSSKLAFAFAGLHTLQEMNADYFQPFYASFYAIPVAFLTREATHQVLANPDPEFLLEYEPAALDHIYDLTNGQPYLTQLIGFQLVRMFNDYVFEQGKPRDRTFTIDDVRTICSGENFFTTGINYFNGVWQQAAEGATHQQDILKALAPHPQGLTESELISQTNLPNETLQAALKTLKDHDVIRSQKNNEIINWAIAVELFRTWVVKYKLSDY